MKFDRVGETGPGTRMKNAGHNRPRLVLDSVEKRFARPDGEIVTALSDVSMSVEAHTFVALIGPSGCGKTTVLRIANGLIQPDNGAVTIAGSAPKPGPETGFVFQEFRLIPWATVQANVEFALEVLPLSRAERAERARSYLDLVGLSRSAQSYPGQLSGGMKQRVALARALASEPEILLMDEPFANLDAQTRELMQSELLHIWMRHKPTVLFVTHSVDEALLLADRIVLMGTGRVLETFDVDIERPRNLEATRSDARFIAMRDDLWARIRDLVLSDPQSEFYGRNLGG
ncbi:ABC transporter ATP-binding protein [Pelagibacterium xiamenense]|uniref:ABC transporter ATP-binding protein n=1 Tax=Pelagibacterium xiamenense TaxID=2901140 RepID=UPI001E3C42EA|nr:ABC transporter ATP-binding protein [Pelagibacterium xiamenense]MCD7061395.1 ABC transporter ATP-binding protein [Pelagibacterium xiamenense]